MHNAHQFSPLCQILSPRLKSPLFFPSISAEPSLKDDVAVLQPEPVPEPQMRYHKAPRFNKRRSLGKPRPAEPSYPRYPQPYDAFLVLDIEGTCKLGSDFNYPNEIIVRTPFLANRRVSDLDRTGVPSMFAKVGRSDAGWIGRKTQGRRRVSHLRSPHLEAAAIRILHTAHGHHASTSDSRVFCLARYSPSAIFRNRSTMPLHSHRSCKTSKPFSQRTA